VKNARGSRHTNEVEVTSVSVEPTQRCPRVVGLWPTAGPADPEAARDSPARGSGRNGNHDGSPAGLTGAGLPGTLAEPGSKAEEVKS
jgi:hypothetical protein